MSNEPTQYGEAVEAANRDDAVIDEVLRQRAEQIASGSPDPVFMAQSLRVIDDRVESRRRNVARAVEAYRQSHARLAGLRQRIIAVMARVPRTARATRQTRRRTQTRVAAFARSSASADSPGDSPPAPHRAHEFNGSQAVAA